MNVNGTVIQKSKQPLSFRLHNPGSVTRTREAEVVQAASVYSAVKEFSCCLDHYSTDCNSQFFSFGLVIFLINDQLEIAFCLCRVDAKSK